MSFMKSLSKTHENENGIAALLCFALAVAVMICWGLSGCANTGVKTANGADQDFITNSYKALKVEGQTVDAAMTTMGNLYRAGRFSEANKAAAIQADNAFKAAYDDAVNKLSAYAANPTDAAKTVAETAIVSAQTTAAAVAALGAVQATSGGATK